MKKIIFILIFCNYFYSCIEDVKLDLKPNQEHLVIDASINWIRGTDGKHQQIILSKSTDFYNSEIPPVLGAKVQITNELGKAFVFNDVKNNGIYICDDFIPIINQKYFLRIEYNNEIYTSENTLLKTPSITKIVQNDDGGIFGTGIEIKTYFVDTPSSKNFYLLSYQSKKKKQPSYQVLKDDFFDGKTMFGLYEAEKEDTLTVRLHEVDKQNYDFLFILFQQTGNGSGQNPFGSIPTNSIGNIINTTNKKNISYGYFRLSEVDEKIHIVK